jgi:hypothetical protein
MHHQRVVERVVGQHIAPPLVAVRWGWGLPLLAPRARPGGRAVQVEAPLAGGGLLLLLGPPRLYVARPDVHHLADLAQAPIL